MVVDETSLFKAIDRLEPNLLLVDLSLPTSKEINIVRQIGEYAPYVRFIILSVHDEPTVVQKVMRTGEVCFL